MHAQVEDEPIGTRASLKSLTGTWENLGGGGAKSAKATAAAAACADKRIQDGTPKPAGTVVELPALASDSTDYAIGALIERVPDSFELFLTTFFLSRYMLEPSELLSGIIFYIFVKCLDLPSATFTL